MIGKEYVLMNLMINNKISHRNNNNSEVQDDSIGLLRKKLLITMRELYQKHDQFIRLDRFVKDLLDAVESIRHLLYILAIPTFEGVKHTLAFF
jgi:hypothetical protein